MSSPVIPMRLSLAVVWDCIGHIFTAFNSYTEVAAFNAETHSAISSKRDRGRGARRDCAMAPIEASAQVRPNDVFPLRPVDSDRDQSPQQSGLSISGMNT
ncbi:hypothetical protein CT0861_02934 [Colletotrichum tofieldiae]|uniref:Uncharacterized protein n=1 Tax=Colletotrichum tofieldiae TaxID=708197 RepID=A0A166UNS2_9PEZI|nr:hypothetical protein CT0861_02934 [Colletotrichum tofieldiae]